MDICHLKNAELEPKLQKYNCRVVLRGDIAKYDSGAYTVFTELGSSVSQTTAAKVMDVIARLPDQLKALSELGWEKVQNWECMFVHRKRVSLVRKCGSHVEEDDEKCGH